MYSLFLCLKLMYKCYILYSQTLNRYYVGHTELPMEERLRRHLANHKGFTSKAKDWEVVHMENFGSKEEAYRREREIKGKKSKKYIEWLIESSGA